jgi:hypothetical protein
VEKAIFYIKYTLYIHRKYTGNYWSINMGFADFVARVLPLTMGGTENGPVCVPAYRLEFLSNENPQSSLDVIVNNTAKMYNLQNPYLSNPVHEYDARG